jgi:hypothetical protein
MDEALDEAIDEQLKGIFLTFFKTKDAVMLISELKSAEDAYEAVNKALDKL